MDSVKETLELVQTDIAKVNREITALKITPKAQIPKKTAAQEKSSSKMDVASTEMATWLTTKLEASYETPKFLSTIKKLIDRKLVDFRVSVSNVSESTHSTIKKWALDAVSAEIKRVIEPNADVIADCLKAELISKGFSNTSGSDPTFQDGVKQALTLIQTQLNDLDKDIKAAKTVSGLDVDSLMSIVMVREIFSDFDKATTKVLANLKLWSFLQPDRSEDMKMAAQNIFDFQSSKGKTF